jgi:hypothetical protein
MCIRVYIINVRTHEHLRTKVHKHIHTHTHAHTRAPHDGERATGAYISVYTRVCSCGYAAAHSRTYLCVKCAWIDQKEIIPADMC